MRQVTVLIRTRERPLWLKSAVASVLANTVDAAIIVVNDGGSSPAAFLPQSERLTLIDVTHRVGRSEAMNIAVRNAETPYVAFLDDDDVYYADHLSTLLDAAASTRAPGYYTDALYVQLGNATHERVNAWRPFSCDFDRELLLCDNYIPLPTLLVERERMLDAGGFDPELDTFEDWEFLIRLSKYGDLVHVPKITCEVRNSGSRATDEQLHGARIRIWRKHRADVDHAIVHLRASRGNAADDGLLLFDLASDLIRSERARAFYEEELHRQLAEAKRLRSMLDQIYRSRSWKLHLLAERVKQRIG